MNENRTVVIDGNSLTFRAFYGLPPLKSNQGEPSNAIYGFCKMLINVIQKLEPNYLVVAFDAGKHTFRHDMFSAYKATRSPMPDDLRCQFLPLKNLLSEMGIKVVEIPEIEADDIIGSIAKKFGGEVILVSGDRDLLQLIDENVHVWLNIKGISEIVDYNLETLKELKGIEPYQVIEMKSIMGDTADNIPGVKGIGEKTASKLISEYGSLRGIYDNIDNIKGKTHDLLVNQREMAELSHRLATIKTDVELNFEKEDCVFQFPFNEIVFEIMNSLGFKSIVSKKELFVNNISKEKKLVNYTSNTVVEIGEFVDLVEEIKKVKSFALHIDNSNYYFAIQNTQHAIDNLLTFNPQFIEHLKILLEDEDIEKVLFDVKAYKHYFKNFDIEIKNYFDLSLAIYLSNESEGIFDYKKVQEERGFDENYSSCNLIILKEELTKELQNRGQWSLYNDVELRLVDVLFDMEKTGVKIDVEEIKRLSAHYNKELDELTLKIHELTNSDFNIKSPKQLQKVLFEDLKLTYKGKKSTNVEVLEAIENQHEVVPLILRYRKIAKLISTYLDGMLPSVNEKTQKIHTTFMQSFTTTGRLSSREPNLQNIPVRDDESKALRKLFISSFENGKIMSADYNQIELRLMAIFSKDENLVNDFSHQVDVHSMTASKIFNVSPTTVTPQQRRVAKAVNFGIIYGISEYGLSKNINVTPREAKEFIAKYFELYPQVKMYMNENIEFFDSKLSYQSDKTKRNFFAEISMILFIVLSNYHLIIMNQFVHYFHVYYHYLVLKFHLITVKEHLQEDYRI